MSIGHWEQREKVQVFLWHLLGCYYKTMQGVLHQKLKMSYFLQKAGNKGGSSLSLQDPVMCWYLGKKRCRKSGEKAFLNQTAKECHKEAPDEHTTGGIWDLWKAQWVTKRWCFSASTPSDSNSQIQQEMRDWGQRAGRIQPKCNNNLSKHRSALKIKKAKGLHN